MSRYLDDFFNIDNNTSVFWLVKFILQSQLNKPKSSETEAPFLDFHLFILDGFVSCKIMTNAMILILRL